MSGWLLGTLGLIGVAGIASAGLYLRARQWIDAGLVLLAAVALAALVRGPERPADTARTVTIADGSATDALGQDIRQAMRLAAAVRVEGDGLSAAQWHDLPARPMQWQPSREPALTLEFPRQLALGRAFHLTLRRSAAVAAGTSAGASASASASAGAGARAAAWKLQLLDENNRLLAEAPGTALGTAAAAAMRTGTGTGTGTGMGTGISTGANAPSPGLTGASTSPDVDAGGGTSPGTVTEATVSWRPPVAEALLLHARVLDAAGQVLAQGPVPLQVQDVAPLQVQARLGAPSFDAQALNALLVGSGALVDWQVTLGKTITRSETAPVALTAPDLIVIDAAHFEHADTAARNALLARVAAGVPLLVLAANASDALLWARQLQLPLVSAQVLAPILAPASALASAPAQLPLSTPIQTATADATPRTLKLDGGLELPASVLAPRSATAGPWTAADQRQPWLWQRPWQAGRIAWLGVSDWHRYAIQNPQLLGAWWQTVLDRLQVQRAVDLAWDMPEPMPLAGRRSVVCTRGARADMAVRVLAPASGAEPVLHLQRRADSADAACAALWPAAAGWHTLQAVDGRTAPGRFYVYATGDWPLWQRALRRQATALYAARTPTAPPPRSQPLPAWPAATLFTLALLGLWWRERR